MNTTKLSFECKSILYNNTLLLSTFTFDEYN
jgi:hypothetical protein